MLWEVGFGLAYNSDSLEAVGRYWARLAHSENRSQSGRTRGQVHLAMLEVARGRWGDAGLQFDSAARVKPSIAFASRAWLAAFPILLRDSVELAALRDSVIEWQPPPYQSDAWRGVGSASIPGEAGPRMREYVLGLLSARLNDPVSANRWADELELASTPPDAIGLRRDLAREIRALTAWQDGRAMDALLHLESSNMAVTRSRDIFVPLYRRPFGRMLRAQILQDLNRSDEALNWYGTFEFSNWGIEYVFLAPVYLRKAQIYERLGERDRAIEFYRRFVDRWQDADAEYQGLVGNARDRIAQLTAGGNGA
jgi:tetratricopeptide (TPR) repeat protein